MAQIYEFGTAPQAKLAGYDVLVETVTSTDAELLKRHAEEDVVFVRGAAVHGRPGMFDFARLESQASVTERAENRRKLLDYMERRVQSVIYQDVRTSEFIVAPAEQPTFRLGVFQRSTAARRFCENNYLPFIELNESPVAIEERKMEEEQKRVEDLVIGDLVDLTSCPYLKGSAVAENIYGEVAHTERETQDCVVIGYEGIDHVGYSVGTVLTVVKEKLSDQPKG